MFSPHQGPPGPNGPPHPHVGIVSDKGEQIVDGFVTSCVGATVELAKESFKLTPAYLTFMPDPGSLTQSGRALQPVPVSTSKLLIQTLKG
jgi:hypothetical protein